MKQSRYPAGWDAKRVQAVLDHYENQTEEEAVVEDEAAFADPLSTVMVVPSELVFASLALIAKHQEAQRAAKKPKTPSKKRKPAWSGSKS